MNLVNLDEPCVTVLRNDATMPRGIRTDIYKAAHPHDKIGHLPGRLSARQTRVRVNGVRWTIARRMMEYQGRLVNL